MKKLTHLSEEGKPKMVDVSEKPVQYREAAATGFIRLQEETLQLVREEKIKKGNVTTVAEIAGIQAAKKTGELIPLCHPLILTKIEVRAHIQDNGIRINSRVKCTGQTGVEMEALTAVSVALLTIYDMCKAVDKQMLLEDVKLVEKTKSDTI
jgi:cyclic pyranopterin monophosphate synthase